MRRFYLTQRLQRREHPRFGDAGFDGLFGCEYMGSAEFEWGALPESLARIRKVKKLGLHHGPVTRGDVTKTVFVVGDVKVIEAIPGDLTEWMKDRYPRGKEMTYFPEQVEGATEDWHRRTHAWWSLRDDVMWALDLEVAQTLLHAIDPKRHPVTSTGSGS